MHFIVDFFMAPLQVPFSMLKLHRSVCYCTINIKEQLMRMSPTETTLFRSRSMQRILSALSIQINIELQHYKVFSMMCPITMHIVNNLSYWNKLEGFILAKSLLRFSDIQNQDWLHIIQSGYLRIEQNKTKKILLREFKLFNPELKNNLLVFLREPLNANYNVLSAELEKIVRKDLSHLDLPFKHKTHIFRHLFASWSNDQGVPIETIAESLGNTSDTVKNCYVHSNLHL